MRFFGGEAAKLTKDFAIFRKKEIAPIRTFQLRSKPCLNHLQTPHTRTHQKWNSDNGRVSAPLRSKGKFVWGVKNLVCQNHIKFGTEFRERVSIKKVNHTHIIIFMAYPSLRPIAPMLFQCVKDQNLPLYRNIIFPWKLPVFCTVNLYVMPIKKVNGTHALFSTVLPW